MGCFCQQALAAAQKTRARNKPARPPDEEAPDPQTELVVAAGQWLAARWLPAPVWEPDPDWMEADLPPPPLPPEALAVVCALIQTGKNAAELLDGDPAEPTAMRGLTRIIATLNRRSAALADLVDDDDTALSHLAALNDYADTILSVPPELFDPDEPDPSPPLAPWRPLLAKVKALAPLIAIGQMLELDLADPDATDEIAERVRVLRKIELPPLEQPVLVQRMIARASATDRLRRSLGIDPDDQVLDQLREVVRQKVTGAADRLPHTLRSGPDGLEGAPYRSPNPTLLVNADVVAACRRAPQQVLPWKVPAYDQLPLLTAGAPVLTLAGLLGSNIVRSSPCNSACDGAAAIRGYNVGGQRN